MSEHEQLQDFKVQAEKLEDMKRYLNLEVPHYLEDEVGKVKPAGKFNFLLTEGVNAEVDVYEVELRSGRKVFAAEGGWHKNRVKNVYGEKIPDTETAAKVHIYTLCKLIERDYPEAEGFGLPDDIADDIELSEQFRRVG